MRPGFLLLLALAAQTAFPRAESLEQMEKTALRYANLERTKRGLKALEQDDRLSLAARQHSEEMRDLRYMSHASPRPEFKTAPLRLARVGVSDAESAENLGHFASNDPADNLPVFIKRIHEGLMKSPGHRANILNKAFNTAGIGIAVGITPGGNRSGTEIPSMWMTQNFTARRILLESAGVEKTPAGAFLTIKGSTRSKSRLFIILKAGGKETFFEIRTVSGDFSARIPIASEEGQMEAELCFRRKGDVCAVANAFVIDPALPGKDAVRSGLGRE